MPNIQFFRSVIALTLVSVLAAACALEKPVDPTSFNQSGNMSYPLPAPQGNLKTTPVR